MGVLPAGGARGEAEELGMRVRGRAVGTGEGRSDRQLCHLRKAFPDAQRGQTPLLPASHSSREFTFSQLPAHSCDDCVLLCLFQETMHFWQTGHVLPGHQD